MSVCSTACGNAFAFYLTLIQVWKKKLRYHRWQCTTVWEPLIWIFFFFFSKFSCCRARSSPRCHIGETAMCKQGPLWTVNQIYSLVLMHGNSNMSSMLDDLWPGQSLWRYTGFTLLLLLLFDSNLSFGDPVFSFVCSQSGSRRLTSQRSTVWEKRTYESAPPTTSQGFQLLR